MAVKFVTMILTDMFQWQVWQRESFLIGSLMSDVGNLQQTGKGVNRK